MMIKTQNVTLSLPKALLQQAKMIAIEENTSLSQLLKDAISDIVAKSDRYALARTQHLEWLEKGADLGSTETTWTREDLHKR